MEQKACVLGKIPRQDSDANEIMWEETKREEDDKAATEQNDQKPEVITIKEESESEMESEEEKEKVNRTLDRIMMEIPCPFKQIFRQSAMFFVNC
jgi:hypothetical protein